MKKFFSFLFLALSLNLFPQQNGLNLSLHLPFTTISNYDHDAQIYFDSVPDKYTSVQKTAYNNWFLCMKQNNNFSYVLRDFQLGNGRSKNDGYISKSNPSSSPATEIQNDATVLRWTPFGGTKTSTNVNACINTNFIPSTYTVLANNACVYWKVTEDNSDGGFESDFGASDAFGANSLGIPNDAGSFDGDLFNVDAGDAFVNSGVVAEYAIKMINDTIIIYKNGIQKYKHHRTFYGLNQLSFYILANNIANAINYPSLNRLNRFGIAVGNIDVRSLYVCDSTLDVQLIQASDNYIINVFDQSNGADRNLTSSSSFLDQYKQPIVNAKSVYKASYGSEVDFPASLVNFHAGYNSLYSQANAGTNFSYTASLALQLTTHSKNVIVANASVPGTSMTLGFCGDPDIPCSWNVSETGRNNLGQNGLTDFTDRAISLSGWSNYNNWFVLGVKETDALDVDRANSWQQNTIDLINEIKASYPSAKFMLIEIPDLSLIDYPGRAIIQASQSYISSNISNCFLHSKSDIVIASSPHWTDASEIQVGLDLGNEILSH